jgi:hypothetical protein
MRAGRIALCLCLCMALIASCSSSSQGRRQTTSSGISIEGIIIRNELAFPVTDVMVRVPATGAFAGCGNVMARSSCQTSFEAVDYEANALVISWSEYGQPHQTGEFVIKLSEQLDSNRPAWLEVRIFAMGQAGAQLIQ